MEWAMTTRLLHVLVALLVFLVVVDIAVDVVRGSRRSEPGAAEKAPPKGVTTRSKAKAH